MSIRRIDTTISTIRSVFDEKGNYLPSGNYYFSIKDYESGIFTGEMNSRGHFGEFSFSPRKLIKMMAVGQSRLARRSNLHNETGMPNYPSPLARNSNSRLSHFTTTLSSPYVVRNYSRENTILREPVQCSICFETINESDKKTLNCDHHYHRNCINTWLVEQNNCPLCRAPQTTSQTTSQTTGQERRLSREDPFMEALNELSSATSRRNLLYNRLSSRDYTISRNSRTLVFPGERVSSRYSHK
mgnify:CR=1 FL=1